MFHAMTLPTSPTLIAGRTGRLLATHLLSPDKGLTNHVLPIDPTLNMILHVETANREEGPAINLSLPMTGEPPSSDPFIR
jgi:hypothetical protein